jgi:hypothetical protein
VAQCKHCSGTGRCQDDYHSGSTLSRTFLSHCPSCGGSNAEWRPECPHCDGTGRNDDDFLPSSKRLYFGFDQSSSKRDDDDDDDDDDGSSYSYSSGSSAASRGSAGKSGLLKECVILVVVLAVGWPVYQYFDPQEPECPPRQPIVSLPASGGAVTLEACWDEPSIYLDLREIPKNELSLTNPEPPMIGRTLPEFIRVQTRYPGLADGNVRLLFNRDEMRRIGAARLEITVSPE